MILMNRLQTALALTNSLADDLTSEALEGRNGNAPSNTIGGQFWCIVGARESYVRAFDAGSWQGFSCSLKDVGSPDAVKAALAKTRAQIDERIGRAGKALDEAREEILLNLFQHEVQHHGQLIRYFYANCLPFPQAFAQTYALK